MHKKENSQILIELPQYNKGKKNEMHLGEIPRKRIPKKKKTAEKREQEKQAAQEEEYNQRIEARNKSLDQGIKTSIPKRKKKSKAGWIGALVGGGAIAGTIGTASAKVPIVIISVINFL